MKNQHPTTGATYLVGGAVRDKLLSRDVTERDWVVVGSTADALLSEGYTQVGRDFPVFLHPKTKDEYALARTERKTSAGHRGFECNADPSVTLEEDLLRRDLTVNAIAESADGQLVDPYDGVGDLKARRLRHVSKAFSEDPLRILRVARFLSTLADWHFTVAEETRALCSEMIAGGALSELPAERVFQELEKALASRHAAQFFTFLDEIAAGESLWPELDQAGIRQLENLPERVSAAQKFAILLADCNKEIILHRCKQLRVPRRWEQLALRTHLCLTSYALVRTTDAAEIIALFRSMDAFRNPDIFVDALDTCALLTDDMEAEHKKLWLHYYELASKITAQDVPKGLKGADIGKAIIAGQTSAIEGER